MCRSLRGGRLLDLACGTGQLAFPLRRWFPAGVWAVDQEPDMVDVVQAKAAAAGAWEVRPVVSSAESLDAEPGSFELAVIGNAFPRLDRDLAARPGPTAGSSRAGAWRCAGRPYRGPASKAWQRALATFMQVAGGSSGPGNRAPAGWDLAPQAPAARWPRFCPKPGSRRPGAASSPPCTAGACRTSPGTSALLGSPAAGARRPWRGIR